MNIRLTVTSWILAAGGAIVSMGGALAIAASEPGHLWPLPGLVLLDWAILGFMGFLGVLSEGKRRFYSRARGTWFVVGALVPLMVLGAFSIGPLVMISLLAFLAAAILASLQLKTELVSIFPPLFIGIVTNLGLLLLLILLGRSNF